ncbi:MAG: ATP-binding protein [Aquificae bacterium]|nr:ATP-binding protein [Aquificota bacterium]
MKILKDILKANKNKKILIMPIGLSGSGKTTLYSNLSKDFDIEYISFDKIRLDEFLKTGAKIKDKKELYKKAYEYSNKQKIKLLPIAKRKLKETKKNIVYIDNTNLKKKARNKFLYDAKDYLKIAVFFKPDKNLSIKRQFLKNRDKFVSPKVIKEQFEILEEPSLKEFDIIITKSKLDL